MFRDENGEETMVGAFVVGVLGNALYLIVWGIVVAAVGYFIFG